MGAGDTGEPGSSGGGAVAEVAISDVHHTASRSAGWRIRRPPVRHHFEHKKAAIETVTPTMDKGGKWRVSGYYIK